MGTRCRVFRVENFAIPLKFNTLLWRHNGCGSVSNHQPHECLLNRLIRRRSKKTSKLRVTGLCAGNSPGTGESLAQMASNAENVSIWWRHHEASRQQCYRVIAPMPQVMLDDTVKLDQWKTWTLCIIFGKYCTITLFTRSLNDSYTCRLHGIIFISDAYMITSSEWRYYVLCGNLWNGYA